MNFSLSLSLYYQLSNGGTAAVCTYVIGIQICVNAFGEMSVLVVRLFGCEYANKEYLNPDLFFNVCFSVHLLIAPNPNIMW